jgi:hypothetical protein
MRESDEQPAYPRAAQGSRVDRFEPGDSRDARGVPAVGAELAAEATAAMR